MPVLSLRARALTVGALVVGILAATGYASALSFARVSRAMGRALQDDREAAALISTLAGALEDEDDVLLISLSGESGAAEDELHAERKRFDRALWQLEALTTDPVEQTLLSGLIARIRAYRGFGDALVTMGGTPRAWQLYHQELAPLVRQGTADCGKLREHRFLATQALASTARDEARRSVVVVSAATLGSLLLLALIAWHVARTILSPLRELTSAVDAMRSGNFDRRIAFARDDELGKLASGFNRMAEAVAEFRRSNLGEVLAANATLVAALEALPEVVLVVGADGGIANMNARARALFSAWLGFIPRTVDDVPLAGLGRIALEAARHRAGPCASRADLGRSIPLTVHGESLRYSLRILPVEGSVEARVAAVVVLDDVTEFARLDDMRTEFIAAASHELRTPLTTLQMTLSMLAEAAPNLTPAERETIATAKLGSEQLSTTVDEFLDLAKMDAGKMGYEHADVDVPAWFRRVVTLHAARFEERGTELTVSVEGTPVIYGDRSRLATALSNVLSNALKYSPPGGTVVLSAETRGDRLEIVVDDEGPGVPAELRDRIFEKYFRVEHHFERGSGAGARGAGIGLYLCRQIVEAHHGAVSCDASSRGGTRIRLELPLAKDDLARAG